MGCDIHLFLERKNKETGIWEPVKGKNPRIDNYREWAKDARTDGDVERAERLEREASDIESGKELEVNLKKMEEWYPLEERENDEDMQQEYEREIFSAKDYDAPERYKEWIYDGRNYDLFAMLANVRNGRGFAGIDTGNGFNPISMPKGLPEDVSEYVKVESDYWDGDGHSHSWLTVKELLEYDWNQSTIQRGVVDEEGYKKFKEKGHPDSYSGGVWGNNVVDVTNVEMDMIISREYEKEKDKSYYTKVAWKEYYYEAAGRFYSKSIPLLKEMAKEDIEDIRIVFWFDN